MIRLLRFSGLVASAVLLAACDPDSQTSSTGTGSVFNMTQPTLVTSSGSGSGSDSGSGVRTVTSTVVDEDDRPVAGAQVRFPASVSKAVLVTDASGVFEVTFDWPATAAPLSAISVSIEKPGYEPSEGFVGSTCCDRVRLYKVREILAGDTVALVLFNDAFCGQFGDNPCRRVRVKSPSAGRLTVDVEPGDFGVALADNTPWSMPPARISLDVAAGSVTSIDVWAPGYWDGQGIGRSFTLVSSVQ
jgi:hypothetical protein